MRTLSSDEINKLNSKIKWDDPETPKPKTRDTSLVVAQAQFELIQAQKETNKLLTKISEVAIQNPQNPQLEVLIEALSKQMSVKSLKINRNGKGLMSTIDIIR